MKKQEILLILRIVFPYSKMLKYECFQDANYIRVYYRLSGDTETAEHRIDFLPDDIYVLEDDDMLDGEPIRNGDVLHQYRQYMVSRGYSEIWLNNPYDLKSG